MKVNVEIKEINLNSSEIYDILKYSDRCIYLVTDELDNKIYVIRNQE